MKNVILTISSLVAILACPAFASAVRDLSPAITVETKLDPAGNSAELVLTNGSQNPLICDQLDISLTLIRAESDLPVGTIETRFTNVFLYPGGSASEADLGAKELKRFRASDRSVRLFRVTSSLGSCKVAGFVDYCQHAPMTPAERRTVDVLNREFEISDCSDWEVDSVRKINLTYSGIQDLTPFSYFFNLRSLRLGGNPITSIEPLRGLKNLERVCLADTPVASNRKLAAPYSGRCE